MSLVKNWFVAWTDEKGDHWDYMTKDQLSDFAKKVKDPESVVVFKKEDEVMHPDIAVRVGWFSGHKEKKYAAGAKIDVDMDSACNANCGGEVASGIVISDTVGKVTAKIECFSGIRIMTISKDAILD